MRQIEQFLHDVTTGTIDILDYGRWLSGVEVKYGVNDCPEVHEISIDKIEVCAVAEMIGFIEGYNDDFVTIERGMEVDHFISENMSFWNWYNELDSDLKEQIFIDCIKVKAKSGWMGLSVKLSSDEVKKKKAQTARVQKRTPSVAA